jgi:hypothetical protein
MDESAPMAGAAPMPESRPGLGTTWGEARTSRVHDVRFYRDRPDSPDAVTMLHYNDERGVRAMAGGGFAGIADSVVSVDGGAFTVQLLDEYGSPLRGIRHRGNTFAIGEHGERYTIRIDNHTPYRAEIVATVDGLDVIDGDPGDFSTRGYVIGPYDRLDIDGFRQSNNEVAAFRFGAVDDSYAERRGMGRNVGVIGVAFFSERGSRWASWTGDEVYRRQTASPFPGRFAPPPPPRSWR